MPLPITTIFFDVGNTLLFPERDHILSGLGSHPRPSLEEWQAIERETKPKFDSLVQHGGTVDHGFWYMFYTRLLECLKVDDDGIRDALVNATRISANWRLMRPGTCEALQRIGKKHRLAIISNADGKIIEILARCGIAGCVDSITDSGVVGYEKPHPAIFDAALKEMNAKAGESLYVGDVYAVDYLGATKAGMQAILFDVAGAYRDRGLPRVESLEELETVVGPGS